MMSESDAVAWTPAIFVTHCPMKKSGFPAVGQFGSRIEEVVIVPMATWTRLCAEIPALGAVQFRVGTEE